MWGFNMGKVMTTVAFVILGERGDGGLSTKRKQKWVEDNMGEREREREREMKTGKRRDIKKQDDTVFGV
jgi:hypothetical protein